MNLWAMFVAVPATLAWPLLLALLLPLLLLVVQLRTGAHGTLARRVASQVALQVSAGFALLVLATGMVVFHSGLVNLAAPNPDELMVLATDIERVRQTTASDEPSLRGRLALIDAVDTRTAWSMISRMGCDGSACVIAVSPRLARADGERLHRIAGAREHSSAWPTRMHGHVAKVVAVPLRNADGSPDAMLHIGVNADEVATQASVAAWASLALLILIWLMIVAGTERAVGLLVSDRVRTLADSLAVTPRAGTPVEVRTVRADDEIKMLAAAVEAVAARSVHQQTQFRTLVEFAPVGIARVDPHGAVLTANPRFLRLLAVESGCELPAWTDVFCNVEERSQFLDAIAGRDPVASVLWTWKDIAGRTRLVRASTVPLPTGEGDPGAVLLVEDVTEQRALESQLQRAQKMELVGRLAGGIAHDFNNLLTVVRGNVSALGGVTVSPELGAIDDAAARGARLVRRLLTISRNDLLTLAPVEPGPLLHEVIGMVRSVLPARIRVEAPLQVPAVTLMIDRDTVEQSLLNLALNARDAIDGTGTLRFDAREVRSVAGARSLVVSVVDDGAGMPAEILARATEPFFSTKTADRGTGLGLSVVNSTMERMGGRLDLRSTPGHGTRAELWFPIRADITAGGAAEPVAATERPSGAALHLLLVDDERAVRVATERALRSFGHMVTMATSMNEALTLLRDATPPDLVITDVMMPGGTGIDLLRAARDAGHGVPFLFVSGYAMESLEGILESDRRTGMLTKPWNMVDLDRRVRETAAS